MSACSENLPPQVVVRLAKEVRKLAMSPPEGIAYITTDDDTMGEVHAEIAGPTGTPYEGHFFQLKLVLASDFPSSPPRGFFLTNIYHPNVNPASGDICVNTLKKDWTATTTISHVLSVIRCLLIVPFPESSLNDEAGKLFMESYDEYARRAKLMANVHAPLVTAAINHNPNPACTPASSTDETDEGATSTTTTTTSAPNAAAAEKKKKKSSGGGAAKKKSLKRL